MRVVIACEYSGIVRDAFSALGHDAISCDILPTESPGQHFQGDIFDLLCRESFDMMIAFPPCTYLAKVQAHLCASSPARSIKRSEALDFVLRLSQVDIPKIAIENPPGYISHGWRKWDQVVYPYQHGDPYFKQICLWLKNLPPLLPTIYSPGRKSMSNHVNSRMSQAEKSHIKSKFFKGVASSMAIQWGVVNYG